MNLNWDKFLVYSINNLNGVNSDSIFQSLLYSLFDPICHGLVFHTTDTNSSSLTYNNIKGGKCYVYYGAEGDKENGFKKYLGDFDSCTYKDPLHSGISEIEISSDLWIKLHQSDSCVLLDRKDEQFIFKEIGSNLWITLPIVIDTNYNEKNNNILYQEVQNTEVNYKDADEKSTQLASFIKVWCIYKHFYSYQHEVNINLDSLLNKYILAICETELNTFSYWLLLSNFVSEMQDGHGMAYHNIALKLTYLPIGLERIENKIIVTGSGDERIHNGDEILSIDGVLAEQIFDNQMKYYSGSFHFKQNEVLSNFYPKFEANEPTSSFITLKRFNELKVIRNVARFRNNSFAKKEYRVDDICKQIYPKLYYINLTKIDITTWNLISPKIDSSNIVFDLRGYPSKASLYILSQLTSENLKSPYLKTPIIYRPNLEGLQMDSSYWVLPPSMNRLHGNFYFLTNEESISAAETFLDIVDYYKIGQIIGSPSAGTNGNINKIFTPGGFTITYTGIHVHKRDRTPLHLNGIIPEIVVKQSLNGIRQNKDDLLEFTIRLIIDN